MGIDYTDQGDAVKEEIRLSSRPPVSSVSFGIAWHPDLSLLAGDGGYRFLDPAGNLVFALPRPTVVDAAGTGGDASMTIADGHLTLAIDQRFLDTATYPLTVDPTTLGVGRLLPGRSITSFADRAINVFRLGDASSGCSATDAACVKAGSYATGAWTWVDSTALTGGAPKDLWMASDTKAYLVGADATGNTGVLWEGTRASGDTWTWSPPRTIGALVNGTEMSVITTTNGSTTRVWVGYRGVHTDLTTHKRVSYSDTGGTAWTHLNVTGNVDSGLQLTAADSGGDAYLVMRDGQLASSTLKWRRLNWGGSMGTLTTALTASDLYQPQVIDDGATPKTYSVVYPRFVSSKYTLNVCTAPADMSSWTCGTQLHPDVKFDPTRSSFALGRDQGRVIVTYMPAAGQTNAELPVVKASVDGAWSSERRIDASTTTVDEVSSGTEARANTIVAAVKDRSVPSNVDLGRLIDLPPLVSSVAVSRSPVSNVSPCDTATFSTAAFNEDVSWTLDIKDHTGSPWRTYTSAGTSTAALNRSWDGKNNSGASLPAATDADFTATVDVADTAVPSAWHVIRPVVAGQLKVRVDTIAPTASAFAVTTTPFSPEAPPNGRRDTTAFTAGFSEASTWTITIKNSGGTTVRTLTGGPATSLVAATWDGKNASGSVVADGTYTATLQVTDSACNASGTYGPINVVVDTTGPAISSFSGSPTLFSPNADGQLETTTLSGSIASDPSTPISWQIDIPTVPPKTYTGSGQSV
jgi:flagellar hook assembly protein FlgD